MLLALATDQCVQTLASIELNNIENLSDRLENQITKRIKTSNINKIQPTLILPFFTDDVNICSAKSLLLYLEKTENIRGTTSNLFKTFKRQHLASTAKTISRWLKTMLKKSGLDINFSGAHSTRHASTSTAARKGVSYDNIRLAAGWREKSKTFAAFYKKCSVSNATNFATAVLNCT
ncbi:hypothetical protein NQ314_006452 [Rhamnusium bicolor]|uniref:Tyr recombinase domain-containing protein n=1 Tax=Rhamnusium bicolor TaxID=1586634 RepID=A0AAV8Z3E3_9CUCU|nr:hypothetical protein NQ314_006452 [Rhamnusium bicolor]